MKKRGAAKEPVWRSPRGILAGKLEITGDIVNFDTSDLWDALRVDAIDPFGGVELPVVERERVLEPPKLDE